MRNGLLSGPLYLFKGMRNRIRKRILQGIRKGHARECERAREEARECERRGVRGAADLVLMSARFMCVGSIAAAASLSPWKRASHKNGSRITLAAAPRLSVFVLLYE
jgi:hypothetical protein